jgi:hypothetical protein
VEKQEPKLVFVTVGRGGMGAMPIPQAGRIIVADLQLQTEKLVCSNFYS